jgi:UDP-sugar transporter A1/2/3
MQLWPEMSYDNTYVSIDILVLCNGLVVVWYLTITSSLIFGNTTCRHKQSIQQIGALFLLIVAAVLLSVGEGSSKGSSGGDAHQKLFYGIIPILVASVLSGLASALCQWASQVSKTFLFL